MRITLAALLIVGIAAGRGLAGPAPLVVNVPDDLPTIQAAIDLVAVGGTVIVAPGTYNERLDTRGKALTLRSSAPEDLLVAASTIVDITGMGGSVLTCASGEDANTVIDGLTFRGGRGTPVLVQPKLGTVVRRGGGLYIVAADPTVRRCIIRDNEAATTLGFPPQPGQGGGIFVSFGSPVITTCVIFANTAGQGGGLFSLQSSPTVVNSAFVENDAHAIEALLSSLAITSCTFNANAGAIALNASPSGHVVTNSILWGNGTEITTLVGGIDLSVSFSDVQGGWPGTGNLDEDPLFGSAPAYDFRLQSESPCIDAGDNSAVPVDTTSDLDGNPRFVDDPATPDTGVGDPPVVDIGAYERQLCPGDVDGNGMVGFSDLTAVLAAWGPCPGCPEDIDGNGTVGFADLTIVLNGWGDCP